MKSQKTLTPYQELKALKRAEARLEKWVDELDEAVVFQPDKLSTLEKTLKTLAECRETISRFMVVNKLQT